MAIRVDKLIGELIRAAEAQAGAGNVLVVLTADHGVAPVPETNVKRKMPGGRIDYRKEHEAVEKALTARYGAGPWIANATDVEIYLNTAPLRKNHLEEAEVERVAAEALRAEPHVFRVYTSAQLINGRILQDLVRVRVPNGFNAARSGDLIVIHDPYWIVGDTGTSHGAPFDYDAHVPILFMGAQVRAGRYYRNVTPSDIAPTLATMLDVETPSGSVGRVLEEMLK
jgi:arylsulfatase A-like enzyme